MFVALALAVPGTAAGRSFSTPTYSSPIALSADGRLLWSVNPGGDNVAVISTASNRVIRRIKVGDEPQSVALDPNNRYAYVANAAQSGVTLIRITNANPRRFRAKRIGGFKTGAEPWNIVASPNGRRIFVANSGQDTITVIDGTRRRVRGRVRGPHVLGAVKLRGSRCSRSRNFHFQPRGLAVTRDSKKLYVTAFFAAVRPGGRQGDDDGKRGLVCRLNINTKSRKIRSYRPAARIALASQLTGFLADTNGDGTPDTPTQAFPNQLQSIAIRGNQAFLPNIAASPQRPLKFDVSTEAFVNVIDGVRGRRQRDASADKFLNLHLGARDPEPGKKKLFFANVWAIAFTNQRGSGHAYVVSAGSDLLVKLKVAGNGKLSFTGDDNTTRYIDLRDPADPSTSGDNAGKNAQGIVINRRGTRAYVMNFVSRNVSVVNLNTDEVVKVIRTAPLPEPGTQDEIVNVGADMFFSSRGLFDRPAGTSVSTSERLSQAGWQSCASCHFKGLTDGVVWEFGAGPRKSVPLNASFNPHDRSDQRVLNYSAIFDEIEDFELNARNVSGPGPLQTAQTCSAPPPATSLFNPNQGLMIGDNGDVNLAPCVINSLGMKANANRQQLTVTLPGSNVPVPALTALREWVKFAVRTPNGPLTNRRLVGRISATDVSRGRTLFTQAGCATCHLGSKFTLSTKNFTSPPPASAIATERTPPPTFGNPVPVPFLPSFLRNIGSFNLGVPGQGNDIGSDIGADEKATPTVVMGVRTDDALGRDYNGDGKGDGYNVPSLLGIEAVPPYYHNGACETLACVVGNVKHRTANGALPDRLTGSRDRARLVTFLRSINAKTAAP